MSTVCQRNKEKKRHIYLCVRNGAEILFCCWVIKFCIIFSPLPFSPRPNSASEFRVLAGFSPNTEISFWRFPNLLDICPVFLLVFSPLETAYFWMLFQPLGDGYSLLCDQKSSFRGTFSFYLMCLLRFENNFLTIWYVRFTSKIISLLTEVFACLKIIFFLSNVLPSLRK